jgi:hypothetical protein
VFVNALGVGILCRWDRGLDHVGLIGRSLALLRS